jgi:Ribosome-binding factor A
MPAEFSRTQRLGGQIQRDLAMLIQRELKDPRVGMITIND